MFQVPCRQSDVHRKHAISTWAHSSNTSPALHPHPVCYCSPSAAETRHHSDFPLYSYPSLPLPHCNQNLFPSNWSFARNISCSLHTMVRPFSLVGMMAICFAWWNLLAREIGYTIMRQPVREEIHTSCILSSLPLVYIWLDTEKAGSREGPPILSTLGLGLLNDFKTTSSNVDPSIIYPIRERARFRIHRLVRWKSSLLSFKKVQPRHKVTLMTALQAASIKASLSWNFRILAEIPFPILQTLPIDSNGLKKKKLHNQYMIIQPNKTSIIEIGPWDPIFPQPRFPKY